MIAARERESTVLVRLEVSTLLAFVLRRLFPIAIALGAVGCFDFQPDPPAGPSPIRTGRYADVIVEYRQPAICENVDGTCDAPVQFFGSWMAGGQQFDLVVQPGRPFYWTGIAHSVPVNWPPNDQPHYVRVRDPHLFATPSTGLTAARLIVGGQSIYSYAALGTPDESGLIYVDDNGVGHNPL
jgi:hypothetical protein